MENLFHKIRKLLHTPDQNDREWDPDKFWNLFEARKRRRQKWITISYSMAAMLIFAVGYTVFSVKNSNHSVGPISKISSVSRVTSKETFPLAKDRNEDVTNKSLETSADKVDFDINLKSKIAGKKISKLHVKKILPGRAAPRPVDKTVHTLIISDVFLENNTSKLAGKSTETASLLDMFEQARKERALRNLIVRLDDREDFNHFWLTVNQQLLANKFSSESDLLHYDRY